METHQQTIIKPILFILSSFYKKYQQVKENRGGLVPPDSREVNVRMQSQILQ